MSNEFDEYDDDETETPEPAEDRTPKALRRAAEEGRKAKADLEATRRELALVKAGVDTESKQGKYFARAYEGELDVAAIKAEWAEISGTPASEPIIEAPGPEIGDDEAKSTAQRQALANGAPADAPSNDVDPRLESLKVYEQAAKNGTHEDAHTAQFEVLVGAAMNGDRRVIVEGIGR